MEKSAFPHSPDALSTDIGSADSSRDDRKKRPARQLSEQQLAKKRQNDREAQRAIRERTRTTIEALERKVKDLEGGQAYRQMQHLVSEKDALRAENDELKRRLASIVALCEPAVVAPNATSIQGSALHSLRTTSSDSNMQRPASLGPPHTPADQTQSAYSDQDPQDNHTLFRSPSVASQSQSTASWPNHARQPDVRQLQDQHLDKRQRLSRSESSGQSPRAPPMHPSLSYYSAGSAPGQSPRSVPAASPSNVAMAPPAPKPHTTLPSHILPTCPFDKILIDFLNECRKRLAMGQSMDEVLGPPWPDMTVLLYPDSETTTRPHSLSNLLVSALRGFSSIQGYAQKIAVSASTYYVIRWLTSPTLENWDMMPPQLRPIEEQITIPHPIWIDVVHWPSLRAKLVLQYPSLSLEAFFYPFTCQVSVNWTAPDDLWSMVERVRRPATKFDGDCRDSEGFTEDIRPTAAFEKHFRQLDNWTTGPFFNETFPWLAGTTKTAYNSEPR